MYAVCRERVPLKCVTKRNNILDFWYVMSILLLFTSLHSLYVFAIICTVLYIQTVVGNGISEPSTVGPRSSTSKVQGTHPCFS